MELMAEADKMVKSGRGFFSSFFGGSTKIEDACEKYVRAGNQFKVTQTSSITINQSINCIFCEI